MSWRPRQRDDDDDDDDDNDGADDDDAGHKHDDLSNCWSSYCLWATQFSF